MSLLTATDPQIAEIFRIIFRFLKREVSNRCHVVLESAAKPVTSQINTQ